MGDIRHEYNVLVSKLLRNILFSRYISTERVLL
jgi:hypothetical protein